MSEFLLELYSEEIPPKLQIDARNQLRKELENTLKDNLIKFKECSSYSTPTRLCVHINGLPDKIKVESKEIKGPKVGVTENIIQGFIKSHNILKDEIFKRKTDKGEFFFTKTKEKNLSVEDLLIKVIPKILSSINWKKSMKWSTTDLMWGRPLRSIFAVFNGKILKFEFFHLISDNYISISQDLKIKSKKIKNFREYLLFLKENKITLDHEEREKLVLKKIQSIAKSKNYKEYYNKALMEEVVNIVENPNVLLISFDKEYLKIPQEIIISTLEKHQRYFPIFNNREKLTNYFFVVANKKD